MNDRMQKPKIITALIWGALLICHISVLGQQVSCNPDTVPPTFDGPLDITIACNSLTLPGITGAPGQLQDNCDPSPSTSYSDVIHAGACPAASTIMRSWTASDSAGNTSAPFLQTITIRDQSAPTFTVAAKDSTLYCPDNAAAEAAFQDWLNNRAGAQAEDNCSAANDLNWFVAVPGSYDINNPSTFPGTSPGVFNPAVCPSGRPGAYRFETVDFVVVDECENARKSTATFALGDTTKPQLLNCPTDTILATDSAACNTVFTLPVPQVIEGCGDAPKSVLFYYRVNDGNIQLFDTLNPPSLNLYRNNYRLSYIATDCSGNTDSCTFQVEVQDQELPVMSCFSDTIFYLDNTSCSIAYTLPMPFISDNCGQPTLQYQLSGVIDQSLTSWPMGNVLLDLTPGQTTVSYLLTDSSGLTSTCQYEITVIDTFPPTMNCQPTVVEINPDGNLTIDPALFSSGVTDNCGIDSVWLSPSSLNCNQIGDTITVQVFARDSSGLIASCGSQVSINAELPMPAYRTDLCTGDTLFLMANPPEGDYDFLWTGPLGFSSVQQNPIIPAAGLDRTGSYVLGITGSTGCTAEASIDVVVNPRPDAPEISLSEDRICQGDTISLNTPSLLGTNVNYYWYRGAPPSGVLITTTSQSSLKVTPMATTDYYVQVEVDACLSLPGIAKVATVIMPPQAMTNDTALQVCEGSDITLGTNLSGPDISYRWTGPNAFMSTAQFPLVIDSATAVHAGIYQLTVFRENCPSQPGETVVFLKDRPNPATIAVSPSACEGSRMTLTANIADGSLYTWTSPTFVNRLTTGPELVLEPLLKSDEGEWTVEVRKEGCTSLPSAPVMLDLFELPDATADNSGPVCSNDSVLLISNLIPGGQYVWRGPGGFMSLDRVARRPAVAGTYDLTVTSSEGCTNTTSTQVIVNEVPQITALSRSGDACGNGDTIQLVATIFPADNGNYNYHWSGPNGFSSSQKQPLLPTGTLQDTGIYFLQVEDLNNCKSSVEELRVDLLPVPSTPVITGQQSICEGDSLHLSTVSYSGTTVSYEWLTPAGQFTTVVPELVVVNAGMSFDGKVSLRVFVDGCFSKKSPDYSITIKPQPASPDIGSNSPICFGQTIQLNTSAIINTTYEWIGPNNFQSDLAAPEILNATEDMEGGYQLRITRNGCTSAFSTPEFVQVKPLPAIPELRNNGPVCRDTPGERIRLSIFNNATPGAVYSWYDANADTLISDFRPNTTFEIANLSRFEEGAYGFYVIASLDGCEVSSSLPTTVLLNEIPSIPASAGDDVQVCQEDQIRLSAETPPVGYGRWLQLTGSAIVIADSLDPITQISGLTSGIYELTWLLSNGACQDYTGDELKIVVADTLTQANAGDNLALCNVNETFLNADAPGQGNYGFWEQTVFQQNQGVDITDSGNGQTGITGLIPGQAYQFVWVVGNTACGEYSADTLIVEVAENTAIAQVDPDFTDCGRGSTLLTADDPAPGNGRWRALEGGLVIADADAPESLVSGLQNGQYGFEWEVENGICGIEKDTLFVTYHLSPQANDDIIEIGFAGSKFFTVTDNDLNADGAIIRLVDSPSGGNVNDLGNGLFAYQIGVNFTGSDEFSYELCSPVCTDICTRATVKIQIDEDVPCEIPTIFTPNNDGVNDAFVIPCLSTGKYPNNVVQIFNQWGDKVFEAAPYNNQWEGTRYRADLPSGTYYYLVNFGTGEQPESGFLILER